MLWIIFSYSEIKRSGIRRKVLSWIRVVQDTINWWGLKNERPTWCHLLFYSTSYVLNMQNEHHQIPAAPNMQHTTNWEQDDRRGNSTTQSQTPDYGYINARTCWAQKKWNRIASDIKLVFHSSNILFVMLVNSLFSKVYRDPLKWTDSINIARVVAKHYEIQYLFNKHEENRF